MHPADTRQGKERSVRNQLRKGLPTPDRHTQRGVVMVILTVSMLGLLGMAGLALDTGHLLLNKTRLQNAADAAALSAAEILDQNRSNLPNAVAMAQNTVDDNLSNELKTASPRVEVSFSDDLAPGSFQSSAAFATSASPRFVKVEVDAPALSSLLLRVLGVANKPVSASAVAGYTPLSETCDLIPVMVCNKDGDLDDDLVDGDGKFFGFSPPSSDADAAPQAVVLKRGSGSGTGPHPILQHGNFQLTDIGAHGGGEVREALAGGGLCADLSVGNPIPLQSGNKSGPTRTGINTRFGIYESSMDQDEDGARFPPDLDTRTGINYAGYNQHYAARSYQAAQAGYHRRIVTLPIGDCREDTADLLAFACFFLLEPSTDGWISGEFVRGCRARGKLGGATASSVGPARVMLYKDPDRSDS